MWTMINIQSKCFCFREEFLRCKGMSCEDKAMVEDLTALLINELTMGEYQPPEAAQVKVSESSDGYRCPVGIVLHWNYVTIPLCRLHQWQDAIPTSVGKR